MDINEKKNVKATLSIKTIIIIAISIFLVRFPNYYFFEPSSDDVYEVKEVSENYLISKTPSESLELSEMVGLREMLENKQFEELNAVLEEFQNIFEEDQTKEYKVYDAYKTFNIAISSYENLFKRWINTTPDQYQPYLAIAHFYYTRGWEGRGKDFAKNTSDKQFKEMEVFFKKAERNLKKALDINPNLIVAYDKLISIYTVNSKDKLKAGMITKAFELFPYSFLIQYTIAWTKEPRWGGSYEEMEVLAQAAEKFYDKNPKLLVLYGLIYYDQAKIFSYYDQHEKALELINKALTYGDFWLFYKERAKIYYSDLELYDKALENIHKSIALRALKSDNYLLRAKIYYAKEEYDNTLDDIEIAETIAPGSSDIQKWKEWAAEYAMNEGHQVFQKDYQKAIKYYNTALKFDEDNFEIYYWKGVASFNLKDNKSALADLDMAIQLNPRHFESYLMIDQIYFQERKLEEIIASWDKFIKLEPRHAKAYLERSGTHYHNKDMESAISDLKIACKLENKEACKRYKQLTN